MILRILFIFLFILVCSAVLFFIYGIFIPAIKGELKENKNPLFSDVELNYVASTDEHKVEVSDKRALVLCNPGRSFKENRLNYSGVQSCALFNSVYGSENDCAFGCIGFGDCAKACPQDAILIKDGIAQITKNCCGCGECIPKCPKNLIKLFDKKDLLNPIKLCNAPADCFTSCSKFNVSDKVEISEQKYFKFWKSCYKIVKH